MQLNIKNFILTNTFLFFITFNLYAKNNYDIVVENNAYINQEVIFSLISNNENLTKNELINLITKNLYDTGNYKNIEINIDENIINIKLEDYSKIKKINFINNDRFKDDFLAEIYDDIIKQKKYNPVLLDQYVGEISDLYKSYGYNKININYDTNSNDESNNDLILNFYFEEGKISKINKVFFEGNINFDKSELLNLINSKPKRDLLFFIHNNYKDFQFNNDLQKLLNFYKNNGYRNIKITTKKEFIAKKNKFNLYFFIDEGPKFSFDNISIANNNKALNDQEYDYLNLIIHEYLDNKNYDATYNSDDLFKIKSNITKYLFDIDIKFFEINILQKETNENKIDILYQINDLTPKYVNFIEIIGNTRTLDSVIRREIEFAEGDAINEKLINDSLKNIRSLGFFKTVDISQIDLENNLINIIFKVDEQQSGDFNIGVAFGTIEGATFISALNEKNIAGTGRSVNLSINTASKNSEYSFSVTEPRFFNKKIKFDYGLNFKNFDYSDSSSYELEKANANVGFQYKLNDKLYNKISVLYEINDYNITNSSTVSSSILSSQGTNTVLKFNNLLQYRDLNSYIRPTNGNNLKLSSTFSPITNSTDGFIKNIITLKKYIKYKRYVLSAQTRIGNVISLQNDIITDDEKFSLGGRWLRGFDTYGAGPRNSRTSYIGGNNLFVAKFDISRSVFKKSDNPIDIYFFSDIGKVFDNKTNPTNSNESFRSSIGYGLKLYSPIGPIGLSWGFPISDESYDIKREFLFSIGNVN